MMVVPGLGRELLGATVGDPGALRSAAHELRDAARLVTLGRTHVDTAVTTVRGWHGASATAFGGAATDLRDGLPELARISAAADALDDYAGELDRALDDLARTATAGPPPDAAPGATLAAANQRAADAVRAVASGVRDPEAVPRGVLSAGRKVGTYGAAAWKEERRDAARVAERAGQSDAAEAARIGGKLAGHLGSGVAVVGSAVDQYVADENDPHLDQPARLGRAAAQGVTVGGAALAGGEIGAVVGSCIPVPVVGTAVGAVLGLAVGAAAGAVVDRCNDGVVNEAGDVADEVAHGDTDPRRGMC